MIGCMPTVTAFNWRRMCFSVEIYEKNNDTEEKIGDARVILGKRILGGEPKVKLYQVRTTSTYVSADLAESLEMDRTYFPDDLVESLELEKTYYFSVIKACIYVSKKIWGY